MWIDAEVVLVGLFGLHTFGLGRMVWIRLGWNSLIDGRGVPVWDSRMIRTKRETKCDCQSKVYVRVGFECMVIWLCQSKSGC